MNLSSPKFSGLFITAMVPGEAPTVSVIGNRLRYEPQGPDKPFKEVYLGEDSIYLNGAPIARATAIGELTRKLVAGEAVDDSTVRQTLASALQAEDQLDFSLQQDKMPDKPEFHQAMRGFFEQIREVTIDVIQSAPLAFMPENSWSRNANDEYVQINGEGDPAPEQLEQAYKNLPPWTQKELPEAVRKHYDITE